jgi:hypothetical protein
MQNSLQRNYSWTWVILLAQRCVVYSAKRRIVFMNDNLSKQPMHLVEHGMAPSGSSGMIEAVSMPINIFKYSVVLNYKIKQSSSSTGQDEPQSQAQQYNHNDQDDVHLSLAERRQRRLIILPKRFRDVLPQPLPPLLDTQSDQLRPPISPPTLTTVASSSHVLKFFKTPQNAFGLFRQYYSEQWIFE